MGQAATIADLPLEALRELCARWRVSELAVFGSALRDDFGSESDIDLLVSFEPAASWSLLDHGRMQQELADLLGRPVDLVSRRAVEASANPLRRRAILETARTIVTLGER